MFEEPKNSLVKIDAALAQQKQFKADQIVKYLEKTSQDNSAAAVKALLELEERKSLLPLLPASMTVEKYAELTVNNNLDWETRAIAFRKVECARCPVHGGACDTRYNTRNAGLVPEFDDAENRINWKFCDRWKIYKPRQAMGYMGVPAAYQGSTLDSFQRTTSKNEEAHMTAMVYVGREAVIDGTVAFAASGSGLFVHGPSSSGKSHFICAVLHGLRKQKLVGFGRYTSAEQLIDLLSKERPIENRDETFRKYADTPVLLVDDLDFDPSEIKAFGPVRRLLIERLQAQRPCIFASHLPLDLLQESLGAQLMNRIKEHTVQVELDIPQEPETDESNEP